MLKLTSTKTLVWYKAQHHNNGDDVDRLAYDAHHIKKSNILYLHLPLWHPASPHEEAVCRNAGDMRHRYASRYTSRGAKSSESTQKAVYLAS